MRVGFVTAAGLVNQLSEARDEKRLLRLQTSLAKLELLIIDELGPLEFVDKGGLQKAFEILDSNRYEKAIVVVRPSLLDQATSIWPSAEVIHIPEREMPA